MFFFFSGRKKKPEKVQTHKRKFFGRWKMTPDEYAKNK